MDNGEMFGPWRRLVKVGLLGFVASAAVIGRRASSDDCRHDCPENELDGRGCCPAPEVDTIAEEAKEAKKATNKVPAAAAGCPSDMVRVPGGTFLMGSPTWVGDSDEHPQHHVTLGGYCIDRTEVTVAAYTQCVASAKCTTTPEPAKDGFASLCNGTRGGRQDYPVNCVDWNQATAYCASVNKRLPSEAEWEYAARGGDGRRYPWGSEAPSAKRLNVCGSECRALGKRLGKEWKVMYEDSDGWESTAPVGSFRGDMSPFGALDMAGNVSEWTADWYGTYSAAAGTNPHGPKDGTARVFRGGGWREYDASGVRGASRAGTGPALRATNLGFRCARGD
jgi:formylglycine-generating enzyme required for sulfatase activity